MNTVGAPTNISGKITISSQGLFHIFTRITCFASPARGRVWAVSAAAGVYFCDPRASPARCLKYPPQTRNAGTALGIFGSPPRGRPHAHSDGCPHDPGRVPKDLNVSARISERRGHIKSISTKYLSEPNLRPETDDALTCRRQPAPRPCRVPRHWMETAQPSGLDGSVVP